MAEAAKPDAKKQQEKKKKVIRKYKAIRACPKCGAGMGEHSNRLSCGRCGYTEFKTQNKDKEKGKGQ